MMSDFISPISRRTAVAGAGATACACAVAACGGEGKGSAGADQKVDAMVPMSSVPVGGGFVDSKNSIVVTQTKKGEYKAFSSVCTHQGCQVGTPKSDTITCPCHGSQFDAATGKVTGGPADAPLPEKKVAVTGSNLHITG